MRQLSKWLTGAALFLPLVSVAAENGTMEEVMQRMGEEMTQISNGLWHEDYTAVAKAAENLARHPMPPLLERLSLLAQLGSDASQFMKQDKALQAAALALKEAAGQRHPDKVMDRYLVVVQRCVACHSWYRDSASRSAPGKDHD